MDVAEWLAALGLGQYETAFRANAVDADVLRQLTSEDLIELGVTAVGHRRKLLSAIARLSQGASDVGVTADSIPDPALGAKAERRPVAVLFADLVGYTTLTEQLGAEAMHALLDAYFRSVDAVVERMGGRVDKHIGDCVMAVFGAPTARGDDAQRAVLAAMQIRDAVRSLAAERGQDIAVHIGVTLGSVVASFIGSGRTAEYAITGESVNLASRLTDAAHRDEILLSDALYRVLDGRFACEQVGELTVKGLGKPVPSWRLAGLNQEGGSQHPLIGRRRELRQFETLLRTCLDEGIGQVALLRGEAGIGKTRLNEEFERLAAAAGFACHRGLVLDFGGETGRDAVRVIVRNLLSIDDRARGEALVPAAQQAIAAGAIPAEAAVHLNDLLDIPQPENLRAVYDAMDNQNRQEGRGLAISQLVHWSAAREPQLLIVEDVHWAKPPLLRSLAFMARATAECPAILVITTRMEGDPLDKAWRASIGGTPCTTIDLGPLRDEDARELCQVEGADPASIPVMVGRAGGNPLFLQQLLRHAGDAEGSVIPGTIQSLVQAAIDRLSQQDKAIVQAASVIGQRIDVDLLNFLTGKAKTAPSGLVERGLLRPQGQEYLFVHALIRDAVYHSLLQPTRAALHQRAAEWFAQRDNRLRAEHLALANAPEAPAAFLLAAREATARYHYETALGLIERGISLAREPTDRVALLLLQGETLHSLGRFSEAEPVYRAVLSATATRQQHCQGLIGLAALKRMGDDIDGALVDLAAAEGDATTDCLLAEQARIHTLRGNLLFPRGDLEGCLREHEAGLRFARAAGRPDLEAAALGGLGDAEYLHGRMGSARQRLEQCVALARELGLGRIEVANQAQVAHTMHYTGPLDQCLTVALEAMDAAHRVGHVRASINARAAALKALFGLARYDACLAMALETDELIQRAGILRFRQICFLFHGRALAELGQRSEAIAVLREGLAFALDNGFAFHGPSVASGLAITVDDAAEKIDLLHRSSRAIAEGCVGHNQYRVYADGVDVAVDLGDAAMLRRYIDLLRHFPPGERVAWSDFHAFRGQALLRRLEVGATPESEALVREAQDRCSALALHHYRLS
jgi:class 3 adenylate cyclase/tetratricopeptide (TPR) repeat protein